MTPNHSVLGPEYHPTVAVVIQLGAELSGRQCDRKMVALTRVKFTLNSVDDVKKAIKMLEDSDQRLAENPDSMYEWVEAILHGMTIYFGVAWYDLKFFAEKREAFLSDEHKNIFAKFGITTKDLTINHFKLDE